LAGGHSGEAGRAVEIEQADTDQGALMSFDKDTRNLLAKTVAACRRRLIEDVTDQLRGVFGLHPDGTVLPLGKLTHLSPDQNSAARRLRDLLDHYTVGAAGKDSDRRKAAYERMVLEISFTVLNRLAALRLCEERGLVVECVRKGTGSAGFQMFERISGGALGGRYDTYRVFLECLFDELALDLGVLFDRMTPQSAVFPSERCMEDVLAELNKPELTHLWTEDETIGWVYQYFNPKEERDAMRKASRSPRNTREMAVRNQFFTPRYVVEFLTDNTLGRSWYEMRKGDTVLKEECRYLVRRPNEVFLGPGEKAPPGKDDETDLSQEELLKRPVYIEHRPKKDPRDLRILDPACGSGHFLLYAFDLLEHIYEEAWGDPDSPKSEATGRTIQEDFKTLDDLRRQVPKLIVEHNLHGIDIDPRAVQIAALALWLRAQKTWKNLGLKAQERPRIARSSIVTAEPMPGEEDMRREFTAGLKPRVLGQIVDEVFEKMKLAGEAGSLLKIEEEIKDAVAAAGKQWREGPKPEQQLLFPDMEALRPKQQELRFDVKEVTDERFWDQAEDRILDALREYAEQAENGRAIRRRLFAEDAARGFAFIDLCRKRYDVVLMNPPFGEPTRNTKEELVGQYAGYGNDIFTFFVARGVSVLVPRGRVGAITNRTGFFTVSQEGWRESVLLGRSRLEALVDLGYGVLDALVETSAYIVANTDLLPHGSFHRAIASEDKPLSILTWIRAWRKSQSDPNSFVQVLADFQFLPSRRIAFWMPRSVLGLFKRLRRYRDFRGEVQVGLQTSDNFRFLRLLWEIAPGTIGRSRDDTTLRGKKWVCYAKGGEYAPYYSDIHLCLNWLSDGYEAKSLANGAGEIICYPRNERHYFKAGLTYTERTTSNFSLRLLPSGCCFDTNGPRISSGFHRGDLADLAVLLSRPAAFMLEFMVGSADVVYSGSAARHYTPRAVSELPYPELDERTEEALASAATQAWEAHRAIQASQETDWHFAVPCLAAPTADGLRSRMAEVMEQSDRRILDVLTASYKVERLVTDSLDLSPDAVQAIASDFGPHPCAYDNHPIDEAEFVAAYTGSIDRVIDTEAANAGASRALTKLSFFADRRVEVLCHKFGVHPQQIIESRRKKGLLEPGWPESQVAHLVSYCVGATFGHWDARIAIDPSLAPKLPDPFDPLPVCPPGMLVGPDGLPAEPNRIVSEEWLRARPDANTLPPDGSVKNPTIPDSEYPLRISWDGVLVDDPGFNGDRPHRDDIVRRVREVFDLLWKDKSHEVEQEACDILGVSDLRDYFRKPSGFFQDHLKRYSKSRRKAPIYWPLSTASGSYTIWLYYHRLNEQTLYMVVNKYMEPKISEVERGIAQIENELKAASGREATRLTDRLNEARAFLGELRDLREELLRIAALPYKPDLNDGVIINAAPLHKLFRLRSWAKDTEDCWKKLEKGDYDWAHLAYTIWPERVREVCKRDRSIAIAHGLEDLCEAQAPEPKKKGGRGRRKKEAAR
jgi:hypothetical protein